MGTVNSLSQQGRAGHEEAFGFYFEWEVEGTLTGLDSCDQICFKRLLWFPPSPSVPRQSWEIEVGREEGSCCEGV